MMREEVVNAAIIEEVQHFDAELREVINSVRTMDFKVRHLFSLSHLSLCLSPSLHPDSFKIQTENTFK